MGSFLIPPKWESLSSPFSPRIIPRTLTTTPSPQRDCYCGGGALGNVQIVYQSTQASSNSASISRRDVALTSLSIPVGLLLFPTASEARERRNRRVIPSEDYTTTADGLKYYDLVVGKGVEAEKDSIVQVHFDCIYHGVTALSSRESKLLAGNRIIAQPYEFKVGSLPGKERKRDFVDNANGLFSAQAAPKPPPAMYSITEGMRVGGERRVIVPSELGYGQKGMNEIPPGSTFELNVQLLKVVQTEEGK